MSGGTIRCKHGYVLSNTACIGIRYDSSVVYLEATGKDVPEDHKACKECKPIIPLELYQNIEHGANFTHMFFESKEEMHKYIEQHVDSFRFISTSHKELPNGWIHFVY